MFVKALGVLSGLFALAVITDFILMLRASAVVMPQMAEENEAQ